MFVLAAVAATDSLEATPYASGGMDPPPAKKRKRISPIVLQTQPQVDPTVEVTKYFMKALNMAEVAPNTTLNWHDGGFVLVGSDESRDPWLHHDKYPFVGDTDELDFTDREMEGRDLTLIVLLRAPETGGKIEFPAWTDYAFDYTKMNPGDAIVFANREDPESLHKVHPVEKGQKVIMQCWVSIIGPKEERGKVMEMLSKPMEIKADVSTIPLVKTLTNALDERMKDQYRPEHGEEQGDHQVVQRRIDLRPRATEA